MKFAIFAIAAAFAALATASPLADAEGARLVRRCTVPGPNQGVIDQIYQICRSRNVTPKVLLATFETAAVESNYNNLNCGDQDSVGVFQQRPSQGWGTVAQIENVNYSTNKFLDVCIPNDKANPQFSAGQLAQSVQRSEFPTRYDQEQSRAQSILDQAEARAGGKPSAPAPAPPSSSCKQHYTVKKGDTCSAIGKKYSISVSKFLSLNKGVNSGCTNLQIGQSVCVKN